MSKNLTLTLAIQADSAFGEAIIDEYDATGEVRVELRTQEDFVMGESLVTGVDP